MIAAAVSLGLVACEIPTAPLPNGAIPMLAPPQYAAWWAMVERCSGHQRRFSEIHWYEVPGPSFIDELGRLVTGVTLPDQGRIVIAGDLRLYGPLVRHEMLHALIREDGHPALYFQQRCGGVVECNQACVHDAAGQRTSVNLVPVRPAGQLPP